MIYGGVYHIILTVLSCDADDADADTQNDSQNDNCAAAVHTGIGRH